MELALNLVWATLAMLGLVWLLRAGNPGDAARGSRLVALGMLALMLFPVISVSDDFLLAQNPAETDSSVRRGFQAHPHFIAPQTAAGPPAPAAFPLAFLGRLPAGENLKSTPRISALYIPFTRPPPAV